jgi:hypothetical protein
LDCLLTLGIGLVAQVRDVQFTLDKDSKKLGIVGDAVVWPEPVACWLSAL